MKVQELISKLRDDTGILINRSRLYHYDRMALLGNIDRLDNEYRDFSDEDYDEIKLIVLLSDIGIGLDDIKDILNSKIPSKEVKSRLDEKIVNIKYVLKKLSK